MKTSKHIVYTIRDCDGTVRYVGMTSAEPLMRLQAHKNTPSPVGEWIREQLALGNVVTICVEKTYYGFGGRGYAMSTEKRLIAKYFGLVGDKLFNKQSVKPRLLVVA